MKLSAFITAVCIVFRAHAADLSANTFGAVPDGATLSTTAIQRAIDTAAKTSGIVTFKPGTYLTGSLFLKTGITFRVDQGVVLLGSQNLADYPVMPTRVAGIEMSWPAALINVYQQSNVHIDGAGLIDGNGKVWWDKYWDLRKGYEPKGLRWAADYDCQRPRLIQIYKSANVSLKGLNLHRSGFWTVHLCYSNNVTVDGITIRNNIGGKGPSTDGVDIDSSTNIVVQKCDIECNDDALCLKAGRDADGLRVNKPSENIVIRDNTVGAGAAGVTFGSETSGGIRNVTVSNIHVGSAVSYGILFKSASTRGGTIQDVHISEMDLHGVRTAIGITFNWNPSYSYAKMPSGSEPTPAYYKVLTEPVPPAKGLPHLLNVAIQNIHATGVKQAFSVISYPNSPLEHVTFNNISIEAESAGTIANASDWVFTASTITTTDKSSVTLKDCSNVTGLPPTLH